MSGANLLSLYYYYYHYCLYLISLRRAIIKLVVSVILIFNASNCILQDAFDVCSTILNFCIATINVSQRGGKGKKETEIIGKVFGKY